MTFETWKASDFSTGTVEINSLDELKDFINKNGKIIINENNKIIIYDACIE